jgi:hypothetical protein
VYRDIVQALVGRLAGAPLVITDLPTMAEMTLRRMGDDLVLHLLHYIVQRKCRVLDTVEEAVPLVDRHFRVRAPREPRRVFLAPQGVELASTWDGERCAFTVPRIEGHQMVVLEG